MRLKEFAIFIVIFTIVYIIFFIVFDKISNRFTEFICSIFKS